MCCGPYELAFRREVEPENNFPIKKSKRALVLAGAGASVEFDIPSTAELTRKIEARVLSGTWAKRCGADRAYQEIRGKLVRYRHGGSSAVNFEDVYHCAHELLFTFEPEPYAVDEYRPILVPFIDRRFKADEAALRALIERMAKFIFDEVSASCDKPTRSLAALVNRAPHR